MFDLILRNGLCFDGSGADGEPADVGIRDGRVVAVSPVPLPPCAQEIDAAGCWVCPGFIDLHTHYDAEVEVAPGLAESVRHGVTTIAMGSCSLSLAVGDPVELADMFCRVEAIPRRFVKPLIEQVKDWDGPAGYFDHLDRLPLGPNVTAWLGHSTIRAHAMGMARALDADVKPTEAELRTMEGLLAEALDAGYLGLSVMTATWDKMDGDDFRSRPLPSAHAGWGEYRRLARLLRARDRIFQGVPNLSTKLNFLLFLAMSTGIGRPPLKTTVISMMDLRSDRLIWFLGGLAARLANEGLGARMKVQALPEVFDLWADGMDLVVFEEFGAGAAALHLEDPTARAQLLRDPEYRARFKRDWRSLFSPRAFHRKLQHSLVLACPDASTVGLSFEQIAEQRRQDPVDVFLDLMATHGTALRWFTVMANDRPGVLEQIVAHPDALIGFSDAGAHLRNMAHYNFPLRMLRLVQDAARRGEPIMSTGQAVYRLTREIAEFLGIDAGRLQVGARADIAVVDPACLDARLEEVAEAPLPGFPALQRLVRRHDAVVPAVVIGGKVAWRDGAAAAALGRERFGQVLRV